MKLSLLSMFGVATVAVGAMACSEKVEEVGTAEAASTEAVAAQNLKDALDREARAFGFNVAYSVHDLQDDAHWELDGDRPQKGASSIKLFTLTSAIAQIARGDGPIRAYSDVSGGFTRTLENSDDSATDATLLALGGGNRSAGIAYTNEHLARLGVDASRLRFVSWINGAVEPTYVEPAEGNLAERYNRMATNEVTKVLAALYRGVDFANDPIPGSGGKGAIDFLLDTVAAHGISYADAGWPSMPSRFKVSEKIGVIGPDQGNLQATNSVGIVRLFGCRKAQGTVAYSYATMVQADRSRTFVHAEGKALLGRVARATIGYMSAKYDCDLPFAAPGGGGGASAGGGSCWSTTLSRSAGEGTCVQSANDQSWYRCNGANPDDWGSVSGPEDASCSACPQLGGACRSALSTSGGTCTSATLGGEVPAGTCVKRADSGSWYRCAGANAEDWVDVAGPHDAACTSCPQTGGACR